MTATALVWLVFVLVLLCNMVTKGKQLRFDPERIQTLRIDHPDEQDMPADEEEQANLPIRSMSHLAGTSRASHSRCSCTFLKRKRRTPAGLFIQLIKAKLSPNKLMWGQKISCSVHSAPHVRWRRSSSSSRSPSSCTIRSRAVSWSNCSWKRRWLILNQETVKQTCQTDKWNAKQFSSTASNATSPTVL